MPLLSDAELACRYRAAMARARNPQEIWVFAYGSLMWHPELDYAEQRLAVVRNWHRRFCLWQWHYRGTLEHPGLMLALDRGGTCTGVAFRVQGPRLREKLSRVWAREMSGNGYRARWVKAQTGAGVVPALTFVVNRAGRRYAGALPIERQAATIASACGHRGPAAEYLLETVRRCEVLGIRDRYLWRLEVLVAKCLADRHL